jgi:phosphate transport system substrate-binding protein
VLLIFTIAFAACSGVESPPPGDETLAHLSGRIIIDGSSTVFPIAQAMAEEFGYLAGDVQIPVGISGTGGGFTKFCAGETDITDASRPIKPIEADACAENGIEFIEIPVAFDGLSVLINPANDWATCLTVEQLQHMWEPDAEGTITSWNQVDPDFPDEPLLLYGPGTDSGTYEYFTQVITGEEGASRGDFTGSEDDNILIQGIAGNTSALGFFGYAYYIENQDRLNLLAVDAGDGCIEPSGETIAGGTYQPLSRPIFIYVNAKDAEREEAVEFIDFFLNEGSDVIHEVGYIPFPRDVYEILFDRFMTGRTGSVFAENGVTAGIRLADLLFPDEQ